MTEMYAKSNIRKNLVEFVETMKQREARYVLSYCMGYYGTITQNVWDVVNELWAEGVIEWERGEWQ